MVNLTRQERAVLLFICLVILSGLLISFFSKERSSPIPKEVIFSEAKIPEKVDINTASREQLMGLPGIGPVLAERIVEYRESNGPFLSPEDIKKVQGIGPVKLNKLKEHIVLQ